MLLGILLSHIHCCRHNYTNNFKDTLLQKKQGTWRGGATPSVTHRSHAVIRILQSRDSHYLLPGTFSTLVQSRPCNGVRKLTRYSSAFNHSI